MRCIILLFVTIFTASIEADSNIADYAWETVATILSVPEADQNYGNTLKPWMKLVAEIQRELYTLQEQNNKNATEDLRMLCNTISQNEKLEVLLSHCSQKILKKESSEGLEKWIAVSYLAGKPAKYMSIDRTNAQDIPLDLLHDSKRRSHS